jgi:hypothetical protein
MRRLMRESKLTGQLLRIIELGAQTGDQYRPDHTPMQVQLNAEDLQPCNRQSKPSGRRRITPRREVYAR